MKDKKHFKQGTQKRIGKKLILVVMLCIVTVPCILIIGVLLYANGMLSQIQYHDGKHPSMSREEMEAYLSEQTEAPDPAFTGDILSGEDVQWENIDKEFPGRQNVINILLIGEDARGGISGTRSDAMLLCSYHRVTKKLTLVSFMRDTYVQIPGYSDHKLNSAFAWGGMKLLNETIEKNFGITIDGNFSIDFQAFEAVIDEIGGVEICLTAEEASYLGYGFTEGVNRLDGKTALTYARIRKIGNGDFGRTSRQQNVLNAVLDRCRGMSLMELHQFMNTVLPHLTTNMSQKTLLGYASEILPSVGALSLGQQMRIPAEGAYRYAWVSEMSVLMPDTEKNSQILLEALYSQ